MESKKLSIVKIQYDGKIVFVLFDNIKSTIYTENGNIVASSDINDLAVYNPDSDICFLDYDHTNMTNPIDANDILNKWNFLTDISRTFSMHFEGNEKKYNSLYHYLFCCATSNTNEKYFRLPKKYISGLNKVFKKKNKLLTIRDPNPIGFGRRFSVHTSEKTLPIRKVLPAALSSSEQKNRSVKTATHLLSNDFGMNFGADNEAICRYCEADTPKDAENHRQ